MATSNGFFFIAISAGKLKWEGQTYFALSLAAPIAQVIKGFKVGEQAVFRGNLIKVVNII